eukprot:3842411-Rhodomonas_salina.2
MGRSCALAGASFHLGLASGDVFVCRVLLCVLADFRQVHRRKPARDPDRPGPLRAAVQGAG